LKNEINSIDGLMRNTFAKFMYVNLKEPPTEIPADGLDFEGQLQSNMDDYK